MNLVIGAVTACETSRVDMWLNSLTMCNFTGTKAMVVYNLNKEFTGYLESKNCVVLDAGKLEHSYSIVVKRFRDIPNLVVNKLGTNFEYVVATDIFDVVFQYDPINWLQNNLIDKSINVGSECIALEHEHWGRDNMRQSFGNDTYEQYKHNVVYNAGTVAGKTTQLFELFEDVYNLSTTSRIHNPDQAALNILIHNDKYKDQVNFASMESGWCCQAGTTAHPGIVDRYREFLTEPEPILDHQEKKVYTSSGRLFSLVHQYNRVPVWDAAFKSIYR